MGICQYAIRVCVRVWLCDILSGLCKLSKSISLVRAIVFIRIALICCEKFLCIIFGHPLIWITPRDCCLLKVRRCIHVTSYQSTIFHERQSGPNLKYVFRKVSNICAKLLNFHPIRHDKIASRQIDIDESYTGMQQIAQFRHDSTTSQSSKANIE